MLESRNVEFSCAETLLNAFEVNFRFNLILLGYFSGGNVQILTVATVLLFISLATFLSIVLYMYHIALRIKLDISTDSLRKEAFCM